MRRAMIAASLALGLALSACATTTTPTASRSIPNAAVAATGQQPTATGARAANPDHTPVGQGPQGSQGGQGQGGQGQGQGGQGQGGQGQGQGGQGQGQGHGQGQGQGGQGGQGNSRGQGQGQGQPAAPTIAVPAELPETPCLICEADLSTYSGPLTPDEIQGLRLALNDEYHAWAVYDQVIANHGAVRPFPNILASEASHISQLEALFTTYGLPIPAANPWAGQAPAFATVGEACAAGAAAEVANADLYNRIIASTSRDDILSVYRALQAASTNNHLPAFQRCPGA